MYSFRFKLRLDDGLQLTSDDQELVIHDSSGERVTLTSEFADGALRDARSLVVRGDGYADADSAWSGYWRWTSAVKLSFAKHGVGADFGAQPYGGPNPGDDVREAIEYGTGSRVVADDHVPMVFPTDPPCMFVSAQAIRGVKGVYADKIVETIREEAGVSRERLSRTLHFALDMYGRAQGIDMPEAKLVMLVTSVEGVIKHGKRADDVVKVVTTLNKVVQVSGLSEEMKLKLGSQLGMLKNQSITEAGRELLDRSPVWSPDDETPGEFWARCYELRSKIVHGDETADERAEIRIRAAQAEIVVGGLLHALSVE